MQAMAAIRVRRDDDSDDGGTNDQQLALQTETARACSPMGWTRPLCA